MLIPPPIHAEIKLLKMFKQIFDIKCPNKLVGIIIKEYLNVKLNKLNLIFGIDFFIILMFNAVVVNIDRKKDIIIEFMPTSGVNAIKETNNTTEPKM